jgi:hypothetical protein
MFLLHEFLLLGERGLLFIGKIIAMLDLKVKPLG